MFRAISVATKVHVQFQMKSACFFALDIL